MYLLILRWWMILIQKNVYDVDVCCKIGGVLGVKNVDLIWTMTHNGNHYLDVNVTQPSDPSVWFYWWTKKVRGRFLWESDAIDAVQLRQALCWICRDYLYELNIGNLSLFSFEHILCEGLSPSEVGFPTILSSKNVFIFSMFRSTKSRSKRWAGSRRMKNPGLGPQCK